MTRPQLQMISLKQNSKYTLWLPNLKFYLTNMGSKLISVIVFIAVGTVDGQLLTANPGNITAGFTTSLVVNCTVTAGQDPNLASVVSLTLSRSKVTQNPVYTPVVAVDSFTGTPGSSVDQNAVATGKIDNTGVSYLSVRWTSPTVDQAGLYRCELSGLSQTGQPLISEASVEVSASKLGADLLVDLVLNLSATVEALKTIVDSYEKRLTETKDTLFNISAVYDGRRYLVSKQNPVLSTPNAQAACQTYGGYLAKVNSTEEHNFIRDFLDESFGFVLILIGSIYHGDELYDSIERFAVWELHDYPPFDSYCAFLHYETNWNLSTFDCMMVNDRQKPRFLCEVPEQ
ncbi:unnamed protein product [Lymnaea stagnalis]|uniref:C-type lectin domain-containing protein n=1 Tax=Lymnaea stagnalis TaxID=6523 RepID=A0AAV2IMB3_LYMST